MIDTRNHKDNFALHFRTERVFLVILALAALLRLWGIWHGYPYSYYPDEAHFVKRSLSFGSLDFNPHWFHKPAFYMYLLFFEYGAYFLVGKILGLWNTIAQYAISYINNPGPFYLIGRFTTMLFSLGSIWVVYLLGERIFRKNAGLWAAVILTLSYAHVAASQDIKADTPAMFFTILSTFFLLKYVSAPDIRPLILSTTFAALGTATKYYSIVMLLPIIVTIIITNCLQVQTLRAKFLQKSKRIITMLSLFFLVFFLASPYNFIDPLGRKEIYKWIFGFFRQAAAAFSAENQLASEFVSGEHLTFVESLADYFRVLAAPDGMGVTLTLTSIIGFLYLCTKLDKKAVVLSLYPLVFIFLSVFTCPGYAEPRHQLQIYPFLAVAGGYLLVSLNNRIPQRNIVYVVFVLLLCQPAHRIVARAITVSKTDSRNIAKSWIEKNIPPGTKLLMDENGPPLLPSPEQIETLLSRAKTADPRGQFTAHYATYLRYQLMAARNSTTYEYHEIRFPWWRHSKTEKGIHQLTSETDKDMGNPLRPVGVEDYDYYVKEGYEYAIVRSNRYRMFVNGTSFTKKFPFFAKFYTDLLRYGLLVKEFSPSTHNGHGPTIKIYKLRPQQ